MFQQLRLKNCKEIYAGFVCIMVNHSSCSPVSKVDKDKIFIVKVKLINLFERY
jgi:hypothetical protein